MWIVQTFVSTFVSLMAKNFTNAVFLIYSITGKLKICTIRTGNVYFRLVFFSGKPQDVQADPLPRSQEALRERRRQSGRDPWSPRHAHGLPEGAQQNSKVLQGLLPAMGGRPSIPGNWNMDFPQNTVYWKFFKFFSGGPLDQHCSVPEHHLPSVPARSAGGGGHGDVQAGAEVGKKGKIEIKSPTIAYINFCAVYWQKMHNSTYTL